MGEKYKTLIRAELGLSEKILGHTKNLSGRWPESIYLDISGALEL